VPPAELARAGGACKDSAGTRQTGMLVMLSLVFGKEGELSGTDTEGSGKGGRESSEN
jgi:hypothetical protein